ncbi:MAG: M20/M25/M40 family metallo-hydrolase [Acidimicrobiales bacterium]
MAPTTTGRRTSETVDLLQHLIRNACVNDGTAASGQEVRNADLLATFLDVDGLELERYEAAPDRTSLLARLPGTDPEAPSLCLNGHTDVVPVNASGWTHDPFGGELIDGEVWGRGAVDMLNLTASMAVTIRDLARSGMGPAGDLTFLAVADEESGSTYGASWLAAHHPEVMAADYVLTENGGLHVGTDEAPAIRMNVGEKGVAWRRLRVRGTPGHGSAPYKADNALLTAAAVVQRLGDYAPPPRFHELWRSEVEHLAVDDDDRAALLDEGAIDDFIDRLPPAHGRYVHACTHTTFSPNVAVSQTKTNVIPDHVELHVDIRTVPGEGPAEVEAHLRAALGDLADRVEVEPLIDHRASMSPVETPLWDSLRRAVARPFPASRLRPGVINGFTDARVHRELGAVAYGVGLLSPSLSGTEFGSRFHGNDERIDVESIGLTTAFFDDVVRHFMY